MNPITRHESRDTHDPIPISLRAPVQALAIASFIAFPLAIIWIKSHELDKFGLPMGEWGDAYITLFRSIPLWTLPYTLWRTRSSRRNPSWWQWLAMFAARWILVSWVYAVGFILTDIFYHFLT